MNGFTVIPGKPLTTTEKSLAQIWCRALGLDWVKPGDDFFDCGGDSLAAAEILAEVKRAFGKELPAAALLRARTVRQLAAVIDRTDDPPVKSPLVPLQPGGAHPPFFCVHGVGGCVYDFLALAQAFEPDLPFYGLQATGFGPEGKPFTSVEKMAVSYLRAVRAVQPAGPYYLGGFSFGGSVALEMAQKLREHGETVALLAILDHTPPPTRYRRFVWSVSLPLDFVLNAGRWLVEDIWNAGAGKRLSALQERLVRGRKQLLCALRPRTARSGVTDMQDILGGRPSEGPFRATVAAHYQALRDYRPKPYAGRVTLFRARTRPLLRLHGRDLGWAALAAGGLEVVPISGNHQTILRAPHVERLARELRMRIERARG
jgi:thioesterase domain-containing protein/acyl carrier protein